jgi:hypothetical protein
VVAHGESWGSVVGRGKLLVVEKKMLGAKRSQKVLSVAVQRGVAWWKKKQMIPLSNAWRNLHGGHGRPPEMLGGNGRGGTDRSVERRNGGNAEPSFHQKGPKAD